MKLLVTDLRTSETREVSDDFIFTRGVADLLAMVPSVHYVDVVTQDGTRRYYREGRPWPAVKA